MREAIREVLAGGAPAGLVIDLTSFEYRFGDWIGAVPLAAVRLVGMGRVCLLAAGDSAAALRWLWEPSRLDRIAPVFGQLPEALQYLSGSSHTGRGGHDGRPRACTLRLMRHAGGSPGGRPMTEAEWLAGHYWEEMIDLAAALSPRKFTLVEVARFRLAWDALDEQ